MKPNDIFPSFCHKAAPQQQTQEVHNIGEDKLCRNDGEFRQSYKPLVQCNPGYEIFFENALDIIVRFDKKLRHISINPIMGMSPDIPVAEWLGKTHEELGFDREFCALWRQHLESVFASKEKCLFESHLTNCRGNEYFYQAHLAPECRLDGSVESVLCIIRNITSLKQTEQALRISEERKRRLLNVLPDLLFRINQAGKFLDFHGSKHALLFVPPEHFLGKAVREVLPGDVADKIMHHIDCVLATGEEQLFDYCLTINGKTAIFDARVVFAAPDEVLFIVRDITELKQLRTEIIRLDRLNIVGEMAAGIAHELRNPLTTVRGFLQMLANKPECGKFVDYFNLMIGELDRANSILSEYLSLAKNKTVQLEPQKLTSIVQALMPLIQADANLTGHKTEFILEDTPDLLVDAKEIRQLLLNLSLNALEASPPGATITIQTYYEANQAVLAIQNQGAEIPAEILDKLGTPFFTTKSNGTGLGLAICYSIAARHNASIHINSNPAVTTFSVHFNRPAP